jgi:hypothetical protein
VVISRDRFVLDRICTHTLALKSEGRMEWFEAEQATCSPTRTMAANKKSDHPVLPCSG